jgi:hypothetical protein
MPGSSIKNLENLVRALEGGYSSSPNVVIGCVFVKEKEATHDRVGKPLV